MRNVTMIAIMLAAAAAANAQPASTTRPDAPAVSDADARKAADAYDAGQTLFFQGKYAESAAKLDGAVALDPRGSYKLLLAKAHLKLDAPDKAAELLRSILAANPEHVEAGVMLASILADGGKHAEVIATLTPLLKFKHDYPLYHMLAEACYRTGDLAAARGHYEQAIKLNPQSGDDWYQLANIYLAQSRFAKAADAYERATALGVDSGVLHFKLASVYFNLRNYLGRVRSAEVRGGKVGQVEKGMLLIDPVPGQAGWFYVAPEGSAIYQVARARAMGIDVAELRFLEANIWLSARRFAKADAIYAELEGKMPEPDQGLFWFYWARTALGLDNYDAYLARLGKAIDVQPEVYKPTLADAYVTVATRHQQAGRKDLYIQFLSKAVQTNPLSASLHLTLGDALWQAGKRAPAGEQYQLVLELEPDHADRVRLLNRIREVEQTGEEKPD